MASLSRCSLSRLSFAKSSSFLTKKSRSCLAQTVKLTTSQCLQPCSGSGVRTICGSALQQNSKVSFVQAVTKSFSSQTSRNFQKRFPPIMACNSIAVTVIDNLISPGELEEGSESEDEATSGRKRIRSRHLWDDDP